MSSLFPWVFLALLSLCKYSHQACTSTVAITTCTGDTINSNKPLHIKEHRAYLSFSRGNLEYIPNGSFKFLSGVTVLQLSYNKIKKLEEDSFLGLQDLNELNLYDNQLTGIERNAFKHCSKVQKLDLGMNKISSIHDKAFEDLVTLKILNLGFNSLKAVPIAINALPQLTILKLNHNAVESLKANGISNLNKLEEFYVNDNKLRAIEQHALKGLVSLKNLDLRSNYLTDVNVENLVDDAHVLQSVNLSINDFKCNVLTKIIEKFKRHSVEVTRGVSKSLNKVNGIGCKI